MSMRILLIATLSLLSFSLPSFAAAAAAGSPDCGDQFCTSGFRDQHLLHLSQALNVLHGPLQNTHDLLSEFHQYEHLMHSVINATALSSQSKGYIQPAEPFFWLQRQLNLVDLIQKAEKAAQQIRTQATAYMEQVNSYLYAVYNLHPSHSTGCSYAKTNLECTKDAVEDAGKALLRLQDTYSLSEDDVIVLTKATKKQKDNITISAADCYQLGKLAFEEEEYERSVHWMEMALSKLGDAKRQPFSSTDLHDYLSYAEYKRGRLQEAINHAEKYLELDPHSERITNNIAYYREALLTTKPEAAQQPYISREQLSYKKLCRALLEDENDQSLVIDESAVDHTKPKPFSVSPLWEYVDPLSEKCFFIDPKIGGFDSYRVGVEAVSMVPPVLVFHNFLTDWECEHLASLTHSTGELRRSTVVDPESGKLINAPYRSSQSVFLRRAEHKLVADLEDRVQALTQLDLELGDRLQISHYAPGGHYGPHHDFGVDPRERDRPEGNRIATVLMYFNHVLAGGATAFMSADPPFAVRPRKGDAVFWYNLGGPHPIEIYHESDDEKGYSQPSIDVLRLNKEAINKTDWYKAPDFRGENGLRDTRHAACPVQAGLKWVANYWIREYPKNSHRYNYFYAPNRPVLKIK